MIFLYDVIKLIFILVAFLIVYCAATKRTPLRVEGVGGWGNGGYSYKPFNHAAADAAKISGPVRISSLSPPPRSGMK